MKYKTFSDGIQRELKFDNLNLLIGESGMSKYGIQLFVSHYNEFKGIQLVDAYNRWMDPVNYKAMTLAVLRNDHSDIWGIKGKDKYGKMITYSSMGDNSTIKCG